MDLLLRQAARFLGTKGILVVEIGHNRRRLERKYPSLAFVWLSTSAGDDMVFLLTREQLTDLTARGRDALGKRSVDRR